MTISKKSAKKIIVIIGQTSVGKSDVAVSLARRFGGEVISADSRQVYSGADLLAGTITQKEMRGIPHHLLSYANIRRPYSVSRFLRDAKRALRQIQKRGNMVIICGGSAMYVDALIYGQVFPEVRPNKVLRASLSKLSNEQLVERLKELDPARAATIDQNNPRRLLRAIEIATELGSVPPVEYASKEYETLIIGLNRPQEELNTRIQKRIEKRMKQGMVREIAQFLDNGVSPKKLESLGLEFKWLSKLALQETDKEDALERLYFDTIHFAKRQKTWWKRNPDIQWFHPDDAVGIQNTVEEFLQK